MADYRLLWHDYKYFPYERRFARREAERFGTVSELADGLAVASKYDLDDFRGLTYFKGVCRGDSSLVPDQAAAEASALNNGSSWNPKIDAYPSLRRQSTRYSAHGLHEYRGKFNPQIVRAVGNLLGLERGDLVLDPFCGSGTTLLEAGHTGWNALGVDINPLGVLIANAKITAFRTSPATLERESEALISRIEDTERSSAWQAVLPEPDYLAKWFPVDVLRQLAAILQAIDGCRPKKLQAVFRVVLSDICREVSLQDPGDLRIRRRKEAAESYPATEWFAQAVRTKMQTIIRAREYIQSARDTRQLAVQADIREQPNDVKAFMSKCGKQKFDAAITSPPYATAMPYLDTQRLSLALLGLVKSTELRRREKDLIGNREIHDKERTVLEHELKDNLAGLPEDVIGFCRRILHLADDTMHGFRRRNVPALLYKYLADMGDMFGTVRSLVRKDGVYALVVGRNRTTLRGETIVIDTPSLLAELAEANGWSVREVIPLDAYHRYDVHQDNSIRDESLIILSAQ